MNEMDNKILTSIIDSLMVVLLGLQPLQQPSENAETIEEVYEPF